MRRRKRRRSWAGRSRLALPVVLAALACRPVLAQTRPSRSGTFPALPLIELPVTQPSPVMALVMSGDGNWASFIRTFSDTLSARGIPVAGLESRAYLATPKTPEALARDLTPVIRHYLAAWSAEEILVVGYSRGADFAPFLVNRLPSDLRARVRAVVLMSPSRSASFEFHLLDLLESTPRPTDIPAIPEVEKLAPTRVICIFGTEDRESLCPTLPPGAAEVVPVHSGHRLPDPGELARTVLSDIAAPSRLPSRPGQKDLRLLSSSRMWCRRRSTTCPSIR